MGNARRGEDVIARVRHLPVFKFFPRIELDFVAA
jgi:hypothetical protein